MRWRILKIPLSFGLLPLKRETITKNYSFLIVNFLIMLVFFTTFRWGIYALFEIFPSRYWCFLAVILVLLGFCFILKNRNRTIALLTLWLTQIFTFAATVLSIAFQEQPILSKKFWFPIKSFQFPECGACGSDTPTMDTFLPFLLNFVIFWVISFLIIRFLPKKITNSKITWRMVWILAVYSLFAMFGRLWIAYD